MSTQPPVRFENYPPDPDETREGMAGAGDPHPVVRPYLPATIPAPPTGGSSRRMVIGLVIGIPIAGILLSAIAANGNSSGNDGEEGNDASGDQTISVGEFEANVPEGWTMEDDLDGTVEVMIGSNRLTAVLIDTEAYNPAVEEIARLAKGHYSGFSGKIGDPVDRSSAELQHATMDGTGIYRGEAARLLVELWIPDAGSGLLVVRVMTAKPSSEISAQAQGMVDALSDF